MEDITLPFEVSLKDKTIVITGAGGVLCSYFAKVLAKCGAKVALLDINEDAAKEVAGKITKAGYQAIGIGVDVLEKDSLRKAKEIINSAFGKCNVLINGAGGNHPKGTTTYEYLQLEDMKNKEIITFFDLEKSGIEFVFNINFLGTLLPSQVFLADMIGNEGSSILNISSMNAFTPLTKIPAYSAAKSSVSNFTQWLAVHLSRVNVRVNAIAPGFFITKQNEKLLKHPDGSFTSRANKILSNTPMHRFGESHELAGALLFLVNEKASSFINGINLPVDGGFSSYSGV